MIGGELFPCNANKSIIQSSNLPAPFIQHLTVLGSIPSPDICVRATSDGILEGWHPSLLPVLVALEAKQGATYTKNTKVQLASSLQATLVLLILYYLDTRRSTGEACPPWLFLCGIVYVEWGMEIYSHHPYYENEGEKAGWGFQSTLLTSKFREAFKPRSDPYIRCEALAALFKIRSHSKFILEQLEKWKRAKDVLEVLLSA
jgi:hypothetical protein